MNCPNDEQLAQMASGRLLGDELGEVEKHVDGCSMCRSLLAVVANGSAPYQPIGRAALQTGERLGRYEIERLIAAGGMGMLYVARDTQLNRRVALKLMRPSFGGDVGRMRLLREAQAMAALSHPNVVQVFELGEVDGRVFVAMELVEGGTLRDFMKGRTGSWRDVVATFVAAGRGLQSAHASGVVHRDFKPENVLVGRDGRPRVGDFGLSRPDLVAEEEPPRNLPMKVTQTGTMLGTPAYMSPEQLVGRPADARSDQYAFCVCLYEALVGQRPFPADSLEELKARVTGGMPPPPKGGVVPAYVWAAIARGLQPDPAKRFADMEELLQVLSLEVAPKPAARRGVRLAVLLTAAGLAIGAFAFLGASQIVGPQKLPVREPVSAMLPPVPEPAPPAPPIPPTPEEPQEPGDALEGAAELPTSLVLGVGSVTTLKVPDIERVAVGDDEVSDVKVIGTDRIMLTGVGKGKTTLLMWVANGKRYTSTIEVEKPRRQGPEIVDLEPAIQVVLDIPGIQRVALGDDQIADVKTIGSDQLLVIGKAPGETDLLVWTAKGRQKRLVRVSAPRL